LSDGWRSHNTRLVVEARLQSVGMASNAAFCHMLVDIADAAA